MEEIKSHVWFRGVDWNAVYAKHIPTPWTPNIRDEIDTHYFEPCSETEERFEFLTDEEQRLFANF